jgi:glyoxylase-like metal-dependent hydrolase (beta-lactamase superfamily II)
MSGFASTHDLADKKVSFDELAEGLYAYTAEGDPNSGIIVGPKGVIVVDAQATPAMAAEVQAKVASVTDKPVNQIILTHYHAVRVLGASGYPADDIICSDATRDLIVERGQQDMDSEIGRFPRLFRGRDGIPGLTWPTQTFKERMTLWLGEREAQVIHIGRAHTAGDTIVWFPKEKVLFAGDTVEFGATPYCGDAHFADWPGTIAKLRELGAEKMVPGRGRALMNAAEVDDALAGTEEFTATLYRHVQAGAAKGWKLGEIYAETMGLMRPRFGNWVIFEHCMPFNVARAFDEARGLDHPNIWTAERDVAMWKALQQGVRDGEVS